MCLRVAPDPNEPAMRDTIVNSMRSSNFATCADGQIPDGSMTSLSVSNQVPVMFIWVSVLIVGKMPEVDMEGLPLMVSTAPRVYSRAPG